MIVGPLSILIGSGSCGKFFISGGSSDQAHWHLEQLIDMAQTTVEFIEADVLAEFQTKSDIAFSWLPALFEPGWSLK